MFCSTYSTFLGPKIFTGLSSPTISICVQVLGAYGNDINSLLKPIRAHEPLFDSKFVVDLQSPKVSSACPPYFIYIDHENKEVSMYIRGLNLLHRRDYVELFKNRKGEKVRIFGELLKFLHFS